jgi:hypothetical protein
VSGSVNTVVALKQKKADTGTWSGITDMCPYKHNLEMREASFLTLRERINTSYLYQCHITLQTQAFHEDEVRNVHSHNFLNLTRNI